MKLGIPFTPYAFRASLTREADRSWGRASLGNLLLLVAIASILAAIAIDDFKRKARRVYVETYPVGDLLAPRDIELERLARRLESSIPLETWYRESRSVTPFHLSKSLIVRDSARGHRRVRSWLEERRNHPETGPE